MPSTCTGWPSQRSAGAAAAGSAVHSVSSANGSGSRPRERLPCSGQVLTPCVSAQVSSVRGLSSSSGTWKCPWACASGQSPGTTRSTTTPALSSAASSALSQARSMAATQVSSPGRASGARLRWSWSTSSSTCSSSIPARAARRRAAGAFGQVRRWKATSAGASTATTAVALGSSEGAHWPSVWTAWPSGLSTKPSSARAPGPCADARTCGCRRVRVGNWMASRLMDGGRKSDRL